MNLIKIIKKTFITEDTEYTNGYMSMEESLNYNR
jgi:hypothetical protein